MDVELKYGFQPADFQPANLELAQPNAGGAPSALRALMKQPDSRAKDLRARHLLSVIDALDWYVTNYDAIRRQFNSGQDRHPVHLPPGRRALTPCRAGQHVL